MSDVVKADPGRKTLIRLKSLLQYTNKELTISLLSLGVVGAAVGVLRQGLTM